MICPITNTPCTTNGCGEKCYKKDSLGYGVKTTPEVAAPVALDYIKISRREKELLDEERAIVRKLLADDNPGPEFLSGWISNLAKVQEALDALSVPGAETPSEQKHTAEPWKVSGRVAYDASGTEVLRVNPSKSYRADEGRIEDRQEALHRAVSCVNACEGMADPAAEIAKLRAFKSYVHSRLDAMGIPADPQGPHSQQGCRIGDRLDIVQRHKYERGGGE